MNPHKTDNQIVMEARDLTLQKLQSTQFTSWENVDSTQADPIEHSINGIKHLRARIIPQPRHPRQFWDLDWGFYEFGVGQYPRRNHTSKVQFFFAGNNAKCGKAFYNAPVNQMIHHVSRLRPDINFQAIPTRGYGWISIYGKGLAPDPGEMAKDMLWIIEQTLPGILKLQSK